MASDNPPQAPTNTPTDQPAATPGGSRRPRLRGVDYLRGFAIVFMALDHVRSSLAGERLLPDLANVSTTLFFTRWITHFCAPTFIFLAGCGTSLSLTRGKSRSEVASMLVTRGLWLVLIDLVALNSSLNFHRIGLGVLWAIGWSMILLAPAVVLPTRLIAILSAVMVATHNLLDGWQPASEGFVAKLWLLLHVGGTVEWLPGYVLRPQYPIIPWVGLMGLGYYFGFLFLTPLDRLAKLCLKLGLALIVAFLALRLINAYGDPNPWDASRGFRLTALGFLHCQKYPPSLLFLLMTMGPVLCGLAWLLRHDQLPRGFGLVLTFGQVPLFFYLLHLPLISLTGKLLRKLLPPTVGTGYDLLTVYAAWVAIVLALYPLCRAYAKLKETQRWPILRYL